MNLNMICFLFVSVIVSILAKENSEQNSENRSNENLSQTSDENTHEKQNSNELGDGEHQIDNSRAMSLIGSGQDSLNSTVSNSSQERKDPESESEEKDKNILCKENKKNCESKDEKINASSRRHSNRQLKLSKDEKNGPKACTENRDCLVNKEFCGSDRFCRPSIKNIDNNDVNDDNDDDNRGGLSPTSKPNSARPTRAFDSIRFSRALKENLGIQFSAFNFQEFKPVQIGAPKMKETLKALINKQIDDFSIKDFIFKNFEPLKAKMTELALSAVQSVIDSEIGKSEQ